MLAAGQKHISDCSGDTAVAVFKWADGYELEVSDADFEDGVDVIIGVHPIDEAVHLIGYAFRPRGFVVDLFVTHRPRYYLLFFTAVFAHFFEAAAPCG